VSEMRRGSDGARLVRQIVLMSHPPKLESPANRGLTPVLTPVVLALMLVAGCSRPPLVFEALQTGKSLNSDNSVGIQGTRFKPNETMYVSVLTKGSGAGTIQAKWTFRGTVVYEASKDVSYQGSAATEFHMQYAGNLPVGDYVVEILIDGKPVVTRTLEVKE
jgi:hypothetical protein